MPLPDCLRTRRLAACGAGVATTLAYWLALPAGGADTDQVAYVRMLERMRAGQGYYEAHRDAFAEQLILVSQSRSIRMPVVFLFWARFPPGAWFGLFCVCVVVGATVVLTRLTNRPLAALPVTLYLLFAGRTIDHWGDTPVDAFLLPEVWVVPFVAGSLVAWRRQRWWLAVLLAVGAVLLRELAVLLLLGGLLSAHIERKPRAPWLAGLGVAAVAYGLHYALAADYLSPVGNEAPLLGTARIPWSMLAMMDNAVPGPLVFGGVLWAIALWKLWLRRELLFFGPYLSLPLTGLIVDRPYWGLMFVSFTLFWTAEALLEGATWLRVNRRVPQADDLRQLLARQPLQASLRSGRQPDPVSSPGT